MPPPASTSLLVLVATSLTHLGCGSDDFGVAAGVGGSSAVAGPAVAVSSGVPEPICGNGVVEAGEICDDFNKLDISDADSCSADCTLTMVAVEQFQHSMVWQAQYLVGGLLQSGVVCVPQPGLPPYPVLAMNHAGIRGFGGIDPGVLCSELDDTGFVRVYAQYRGEPWSPSGPDYALDNGVVSEGQVELCLGEVHDVAALVRGVLRRPDVDKDAVYAAGSDHGGCVALQLAARAKQLGLPPLRAVTTLAAHSDYAALYTHALAGSATEPELADLVAVLDDDAGNPGGETARHAARSVLEQAGALVASRTPVLFMHRIDDPRVPLSQACSLHAELRALGADPLTVQLLGDALATDPLADAACADVVLETAMPATFDARYYFLPLADVDPPSVELHQRFLQMVQDHAAAHPGPP